VTSSVPLVRIGGVRNAYRILVGKDNIQLGSKNLWQNSVKVEVREMEKYESFLQLRLAGLWYSAMCCSVIW
jgi:hypothetical protein